MTPDREALLNEIRTRALSDEGINDQQMAEYQARQQALMQIAEEQGGAEAIRASVENRAPRSARATAAEPIYAPVDRPAAADPMSREAMQAATAYDAVTRTPIGNPLREAAAAPQVMPPEVAAAVAVEDPAYMQRFMSALQGLLGGGPATPQQAPQQGWAPTVPQRDTFIGRPMR